MNVETWKKHSKVTLKINNNIQNGGGGSLLQQIKPLIIFETILGVDRLFLYDCGKWGYRLIFAYNMLLVFLSIPVLVISEIYSTSQLLFKDVMVIEYLLLALVAVLQRRKLKAFLLGLQSFDERLNVENDRFLTIMSRYSYIMIVVILSYNIIENIFCFVFTDNSFISSYSIYVVYMGFIIRETETVFLCILLLMVLKRLCVLRAHVAKVFSVKAEMGTNCTYLVKIEAILQDLSNKVRLDVTSLHKAYDSLHKCSEQLNYILSIPIMIMLTAAGFTTIMVLRNMILLLQQDQIKLHNMSVSKGLVAFGAGRCLRSIIFLTIPCYYANTTKKQVEYIRTMIYDTLSTTELDKVERRKIKAFFQLTCDNEFAYGICGIVRLDMSLPLRFLSLCLTYLIIVVQFSKFIN